MEQKVPCHVLNQLNTYKAQVDGQVWHSFIEKKAKKLDQNGHTQKGNTASVYIIYKAKYDCMQVHACKSVGYRTIFI